MAAAEARRDGSLAPQLKGAGFGLWGGPRVLDLSLCGLILARGRVVTIHLKACESPRRLVSLFSILFGLTLSIPKLRAFYANYSLTLSNQL